MSETCRDIHDGSRSNENRRESNLKLSVFTINYNHAQGLGKTIDSALSQTFQDFEYIVIDGGSADCSRAIIKAHADRIAHWVSEPDSGIYNAMNKGLDNTFGDFVYFLNG